MAGGEGREGMGQVALGFVDLEEDWGGSWRAVGRGWTRPESAAHGCPLVAAGRTDCDGRGQEPGRRAELPRWGQVGNDGTRPGGGRGGGRSAQILEGLGGTTALHMLMYEK